MDLLFHGTGVYCLASILEEDRLHEGVHWGKPGEPHGPRLSRSATVAAEFIGYNMHWGEGGVLVLDKKRLSADFEIVSYTDRTYEGGLFGKDEEEEVPLTSVIPSLSRYLVSVVCNPKVIELAFDPENMSGARSDCGWPWAHESDELAAQSLRRLAASPLLNRWIPSTGLPRIGNWLTPCGDLIEAFA